MPFTGSHPAAVLPVVGTALPAAALVIGAMVPDLPYYLPIPGSGIETHSWLGVVTVDLVLGLVCFGIWSVLAVRPLLAVAPESVRTRVPGSVLHPLRTAGARVGRGVAVGVAAVVVALVIGAATHVFWDSFTHADRWGTTLVPWLAQVHAGVPGWQWAQWASGVVGAALIVWWCVRWWRRTPPMAHDELPPRLTRGFGADASPRRIVGSHEAATQLPGGAGGVAGKLSPAVTAAVFGVIMIVGAVVAIVAGWGPWQAGSAFDHVLFVTFTRGMGAALVAAVGAMSLWHLVSSR